jgi:SSS family solute:Na+ symporter
VVIGMISKRKTKSASDFTKSSQGLGWVMMAFAFTLIPLGAGHTLSLWESAPALGASVMWWGIVTGGIFLPIMMLWLGPIVRQSGCNNIPEILEHVIDKKFGRLNAGVNIATWTGIGSSETLATATAIYGLGGYRLEGHLPGNPFVWCTLFALILIIIYVIFGGILQMAMLNVVNAIVMIAGSYTALALLGGWLAANVGGWEGIKEIYEGMGTVGMLSSYDLGNSMMWTNVIIPVAVLHITAGAVGQNMNSPFFAAKTDADCRKGVFLGTFFNIAASVPWICMALTAAAITLTPSLQNLLPNLIGNENAAKLNPIELALTALPAPIVGLLMVSLLCATLSTGGATIMANANILTNEIFKKALKPDMSEETRFKLMRISVLICGAFFATPAFLNAVIFPIFLWCFSFGIPVFVIYVMGLHVRRNITAAWITIIVAYAVNFYWTFLTPPWAANYLNGAFSLNMYPVTIVSVILGVILPLVLPGGKPPFLQKGQDFAAADRLAAQAE